MLETILDLHIHSKYSRACSKNLELLNIGRTCEKVGINIVATGDFTHPLWFKHLKENLVEDTAGLYKVKSENSPTRFILGTEIASIKKHAGATRRLHLLIFAPNLETIEKFNNKLISLGINLNSDGRPIIGLTAKNILEIMLEIDERMVMIPAHAWTPWFGVFGSKGGYNSLEECFEDLTPWIRSIETGLSSDPLMNWRWSALDKISLISNSDAHSLQKLGREANVFSFSDKKKINYEEIFRVIQNNDTDVFKYTIEFFPEEGKYHFDGHATCKFVSSPDETKKINGICPICRRPLTIGVMNRVEELADTTEIKAKQKRKVPYKNLVPLKEIIADTLKLGTNSKKVNATYDKLLNLGSEFYILLHATASEVEKYSHKSIARAVEKVREGRLHISPGYDGIFGSIKVFSEDEDRGIPEQRNLGLEI